MTRMVCLWRECFLNPCLQCYPWLISSTYLTHIESLQSLFARPPRPLRLCGSILLRLRLHCFHAPGHYPFKSCKSVPRESMNSPAFFG